MVSHSVIDYFVSTSDRISVLPWEYTLVLNTIAVRLHDLVLMYVTAQHSLVFTTFHIFMVMWYLLIVLLLEVECWNISKKVVPKEKVVKVRSKENFTTWIAIVIAFNYSFVLMNSVHSRLHSVVVKNVLYPVSLISAQGLDGSFWSTIWWFKWFWSRCLEWTQQTSCCKFVSECFLHCFIQGWIYSTLKSVDLIWSSLMCNGNMEIMIVCRRCDAMCMLRHSDTMWTTHHNLADFSKLVEIFSWWKQDWRWLHGWCC